MWSCTCKQYQWIIGILYPCWGTYTWNEIFPYCQFQSQKIIISHPEIPSNPQYTWKVGYIFIFVSIDGPAMDYIGNIATVGIIIHGSHIEGWGKPIVPD